MVTQHKVCPRRHHIRVIQIACSGILFRKIRLGQEGSVHGYISGGVNIYALSAGGDHPLDQHAVVLVKSDDIARFKGG